MLLWWRGTYLNAAEFYQGATELFDFVQKVYFFISASTHVWNVPKYIYGERKQ
jgi:hypothetical protein